MKDNKRKTVNDQIFERAANIWPYSMGNETYLCPQRPGVGRLLFLDLLLVAQFLLTPRRMGLLGVQILANASTSTSTPFHQLHWNSMRSVILVK